MNTKRITTVLVDTCAFRDANSDFLGISKQLLPAFFATLREKSILLLTHPVLENEIHKHIKDSGLFNDFHSFKNILQRCMNTLKYLDCCDEMLFAKINEVDICSKLFESFKEHYQNAVCLEYGDPATVFAQYFNGPPPFSITGNKKLEFPDAFVINSTKQYLTKHPNDILLVVSKDGDWLSAFERTENVITVSSIREAQTMINDIDSILSTEMLKKILHGAREEILAEALHSIECECFELEDYEETEATEIVSIDVENLRDTFVPLKITRESLLLDAEIVAKVSGHAEVFDEANSVWDSEDGEYIFASYADMDFVDAEVNVECEILISFDFDDPEGTAQVIEFKLLNKGNIPLCCTNATITRIDEDELATRALREDKGYPRRIY